MRKLLIVLVVVAVLVSGILSTANVRAGGGETGVFPDRVFNVVKAKGSPASNAYVAQIAPTVAGTWSVRLDSLAGSSIVIDVYGTEAGVPSLLQTSKLHAVGETSPEVSLFAAASYEAHFTPYGKAGTSVLSEHFTPISANHAPVLTAITASTETAEVGQTITFSASATDSDGDPLSYAWDFGDAGTAAGSEATHAYALPGHFIATVTVSDSRGGVVTNDGDLVFVKVHQPVITPPSAPGETGPVAAILAASAAVVAPGTEVRFSADASWAYVWWQYYPDYGWYDATWYGDSSLAAVLRYAWGDGTPETLGDPWNAGTTNHTFVATGSHLVVLTVTVTGPTGPSSASAGYTVRTTSAPIVDQLKYPSVFTKAAVGEPMYLDPAVDYEPAGGGVIQNVYETLVWYPEGSADTTNLVPRLAIAIPTVANGGISPDGLTYTFTIRSGVTFQDGTPMTAQDVAFSFRRVLAIHDVDGPSWMLEQLLTNYVSYYADDYGSTMVWDWIATSFPSVSDVPANMLAVLPPESEWATTPLTTSLAWDLSNSSVELASPNTVVLHLTHAYAGFLQILAYTVGSVVSEAYVVAHGGVQWGAQNVWMNGHAMGTGPFELLAWIPNERATLVRYPGYWRGPAQVAEVDLERVSDATSRELMLQAGDADTIDLDRSLQYDIMDAGGNPVYPGLRIVKDQPTFLISAVGFNQNINVRTYPVEFPLSVPATFFSDRHIRRAFSYAFDYDTFIQNVMYGGGIRLNGAIPMGMFGYNSSLTPYPFDMTQTRLELSLAANLATGHSYLQDGFEITLFYNAGNFARQAICQLLKTSLESLNGQSGVGQITVNVQALGWSAYLYSSQHGGLPLVFAGWYPDYADPDDYVVPFLESFGTFAIRLGYHNPFVDAMIDSAAAELDPADRAKLYRDLSALAFDDAPYLWAYQATNFHVERTWVSGYYFNPMLQDLNLYPLAKA